MRCWRPRRTAAPGWLFSLVASAAFAGPPGIQSSDMELAASSTAEQSSQRETAEGGRDPVREVSCSASGVANGHAVSSSAPAHGEVDTGDGGKKRRKDLDDLVVEFLERL